MTRNIRATHRKAVPAANQTNLANPSPDAATIIARAGDFMAHWPDAPMQRNPVAASVVVEWFKAAFKSGPVPDDVSVQTLVRWLNVAGPWDTDLVKRLTTLPPEYNKLSKAIATILDVAPIYIERSIARSQEITGDEYRDYMSRKWHDRRARTLRALLIGARAGAVEFPLLEKGGKKSRRSGNLPPNRPHLSSRPHCCKPGVNRPTLTVVPPSSCCNA